MHRKDNIPIDTSKGYETHDLPVKGVTIGVIAFFIFTAVSGVLGLVFLAVIPGGGLGPREPVTRRVIPKAPAPLLQNNITSVVDLWNLRAKENTQLHREHPVWADQAKGTVKLPIDKAIEIEVQRLESGGTQ